MEVGSSGSLLLYSKGKSEQKQEPRENKESEYRDRAEEKVQGKQGV